MFFRPIAIGHIVIMRRQKRQWAKKFEESYSNNTQTNNVNIINISALNGLNYPCIQVSEQTQYL